MIRTANPPATPKRNVLKIYALEAKVEFLKLLRLPIYAISTIIFPVMFYLIFGASFGSNTIGDVTVSTYMLATYGAFGVIGAALFSFGVGVATERAQGWMRLKRASPMPGAAYFVAKILMALAFGAVVVIALSLAGVLAGGVRLEPLAWLQLFGVLLLGVFPFASMGLAFAYFLGPNSAPAVLNLVYMPLVFASGLWIPISQLPRFFQNLAPFLPPYHYSQLALKTIGAGDGGSVIVHVAYLVGFTIVVLMIALIGYRRDEGKTYG